MCSFDVKNGKLVRIRPFHFDEKQSWESLNPWTIEARGHSFTCPKKSEGAPFVYTYKNSIYGPDRIQYPLKRVDWSPENRNTQNRGKSKYVRITWDEAIQTIASEIKRIHDEYGPYGVLLQSDGHGEAKGIAMRHGSLDRVLRWAGDYTKLVRNPDSWEGWHWGAKHVWGMEGNGKMADHTNVWTDALRNTELILNWAGDGQTTPWGGGNIQMCSTLHYWLKDVGIEMIYIDPGLNFAGNVHASKWIPVIPNRDDALFLGINYVWMTEGTYDEDFVRNANYCVGFDKWEAYVLGDEDGIPKTPEWAAPRCGVPEWTIKALARRWASRVTSQAGGNYGSGYRGPYSTEPARMMIYSLAMQGLGNPGVHQLSYIEVGGNGLPGPRIAGHLSFAGGGATPIPGAPRPAQHFWKPMYSQAILDSPITYYNIARTRLDQFVKYTYPMEAEGGTKIHMIWMSSCCNTVCLQNGFRLTEAFRDPSIEFMCAQHMTMEDDVLYCDIVLPTTRMGENNDIFVESSSGTLNVLLWEKRCALIGEAKTDFECAALIAKELEKYGDQFANLYAKFSSGAVDGAARDWDELVVARYESLQPEVKAMISLEGLKEQECFVVPSDPDWEDFGVGGLTKLRADPAANPLTSQTGKIEFECQDLKDNFPDDRERPPVAAYITGGPGWTHDESLWGERCKTYPFLLVTNHPRWREHAQTTSSAWMHEIPTCRVRGPDGYMYEPIWIHPTDAAAKGIVTGDIVKMYNQRGIVLGGAYVTQRIMPGAVWQDHGSAIDEIARGQIDRGGSNNMICPLWGISQYCLGGEATSGYLVQIEKLSLDEMEQWKKDYPDAFARKYDYAYGCTFEAWIADEGGTD